MPATSQAQQRFMGAAYGRKKAGHPRAGDPEMSIKQFRDFASTPRKGLPRYAKPRGSNRR
jgi:hypothetical protein